MADMTRAEAFRIARKTLADAHPMERAIVKGLAYMVPRERLPNGLAKSADVQEACDAYNWLADNHGGTD